MRQYAGPKFSVEDSELVACPECPYRGPQCGSRGKIDSPIVFVGEAPGHEEIRKVPLVGNSGDLFWATLPPSETMNEWGIPLEDMLILNSAQCMPPRNKKNKAKNQENVKRAMLACRGRLLEQISRHPRKIIVAMGNFALWSLTGNMGLKITQVRGQLFPSELAEYGILAAVHPAAILRLTGNYRQYKMDINYALDLLRGFPRKEPKPTYFLLCDTPEKVQTAVRKLIKAPVIDCDIETTGFNPRVDDILALGISRDPGMVYIFPGSIRSLDRALELEADQSWLDGQESMIPHLREFFRNYKNKAKFTIRKGVPGCKWQPNRDWLEEEVGGKQCWHNGKFDISFMREENVDIESAYVDEDTMLMSYALDEQGGIHDLEQVAGDLLGAPDYKYMIKPWTPRRRDSYAKIPRNALYNYLAFDVDNTGNIRRIMRQRIADDPKLEKLYTKLLVPASETLYWIENRGMPISRLALRRQQRKLQKELDDASNIVQQEAQKLGVEGFVNPASPQQMAWLFYDVAKLKPPPGAGRSTDKATRAQLPQIPVVKAYSSFKDAQKKKGTYADALLESIDPVSGRIHPTLAIHGTRTGRLAHKKVANIPRNKSIRGMFSFENPLQHVLEKISPEIVARHGYPADVIYSPSVGRNYKSGGRIYVKADIDQAELRSLACCSGDAELCEIYRDNKRKLHKELSDKIWGSPGDSEGKKGGEYRWGNEEYMRAKSINFGIVYGRQAPSIADAFNIPISEAQGYLDFWKDLFPDAWAFIQWCRSAPRHMRTLVTPFGRKKRHWVVTRETLNPLENEASNFPHQSIASDIVLDASQALSPILRKMDVHIVFLVHDEILVDCPDDIGLIREVRQMIPEEIEATPRRWGITRVPFKADTSVGRRWGIYRSTDKKGLWIQHLRSKIRLVSDLGYQDVAG